MYPQQAFPGTRVVKEKGNGKGRTGKVIELLSRSGMMVVEFDDNKLRETVNPYEFKSLPREGAR